MFNQDLLFNKKKKTLLKKAKIEKKREKKNIVTMNFLLNCNQHLNKEKKNSCKYSIHIFLLDVLF